MNHKQLHIQSQTIKLYRTIEQYITMYSETKKLNRTSDTGITSSRFQAKYKQRDTIKNGTLIYHKKFKCQAGSS